MRDDSVAIRVRFERPVDFTIWFETNGLVAEAPLYFFEGGSPIKRDTADSVFEDRWEVGSSGSKPLTLMFHIRNPQPETIVCVELNDSPHVDDPLGGTRMQVERESNENGYWIEPGEWDYPETLRRTIPD